MVQVTFADRTERPVGRRDITDFHLLVAHKRDRNDVCSVQVAAEYSGGYGIAVQADQEIKKGRAVGDEYALRAFLRAVQFLRIIEGIIDSLLVGQPRKVF